MEIKVTSYYCSSPLGHEDGSQSACSDDASACWTWSLGGYYTRRKGLLCSASIMASKMVGESKAAQWNRPSVVLSIEFSTAIEMFPNIAKSLIGKLERTEPLKVLSPSPPLLPGVVRGQPLSSPGQFIDAPPPECPLCLVKVSPRPLPRKTGLKGGVPF